MNTIKHTAGKKRDKGNKREKTILPDVKSVDAQSPSHLSVIWKKAGFS